MIVRITRNNDGAVDYLKYGKGVVSAANQPQRYHQKPKFHTHEITDKDGAKTTVVHGK
ncbi:hypothetical protein [Vibrio crassostreae]|uniref:hypothetical protein n=1 Tax=Vibrio crassostreae TaxID=246167 RepID=UPI001B30080A|nr:hypothetical protein [Vibrio crassostreae]